MRATDPMAKLPPSPREATSPQVAGNEAGRNPVSVRLGDPIRSADVAGLRAGVATALRSTSPTVVVDVSGVRRLSSTTVTALLWAQRRCRARGGAVILQGLSRQGARSLRRSGLWQVLVATGAECTGPDENRRLSA